MLSGSVEFIVFFIIKSRTCGVPVPTEGQGLRHLSSLSRSFWLQCSHQARNNTETIVICVPYFWLHMLREKNEKVVKATLSTSAQPQP
ncbi:hypothetical protein MHYP_G00255060 [Metynnis hypsauchen]